MTWGVKTTETFVFNSEETKTGLQSSVPEHPYTYTHKKNYHHTRKRILKREVSPDVTNNTK